MTHKGYTIRPETQRIPGIGTRDGLAIYLGDRYMARCCASEAYARHVIDAKIATGEWQSQPDSRVRAPAAV